jgi:hypothetical protein
MEQPSPPPPPGNAVSADDPSYFDALGEPSNPIAFPRPQLFRGRRDDVLCYDESRDQHEVLKDVLFRDFTRQGNTNNNYNSSTDVQFAYWRIPYKEPIATIMGHVEMCRVLRRMKSSRGDTDDDNGNFKDDRSSSSSDYDDDGEDDIVFVLTDEMVAVKVNYADRMDRLRDRHAENPLQEIAAMQLLGENPIHVLGCREVLFDGQNLNVVMRFADSGDLFQLLQDHQNRPNVTSPGLGEGEARFWFRQIMAGVQFLHDRGICHRDLSPENIMIDGSEGIIIDMGMCLRVPYIDPNDHQNRVDISLANGMPRCLFKPQGPCGKLPYMCPEIYANRRPFDGAAADVWTCGTILFCMITGNRSYQRPHISDPQFYWMSQGLAQLLSDWNVTISPECLDLLKGMIQIDPRRRFTIERVRNHPWFDLPDEAPERIMEREA